MHAYGMNLILAYNEITAHRQIGQGKKGGAAAQTMHRRQESQQHQAAKLVRSPSTY